MPRHRPGRNTYFYPRPPRGGRPHLGKGEDIKFGFLSTPSARRATFSLSSNGTVNLFLSTPSARRATDWACAGHP